MTHPKRYHLYFDESGRFCETSTDPVERQMEKRRFPSQLAGIVVADGTQESPGLLELVDRIGRRVGIEFGEEVHGTELKKHPSYQQLLVGVAEEIRSQGIQAVRIVNREGVSFGDRRASYTNIVTELAVRVLERLARATPDEFELVIWPAIVVTSDDMTVPRGEREILGDEYRKRIQEAMSLLAVRMGWAENCAKWRIRFERTLSGKKDPRLQICDLLSHGSHDDYRAGSPESRAAFERAFGDFDFTLAIPEIPTRVAGLRDRGNIGLALREIAEDAIGADRVTEHAAALEELRGELIDDLIRIGGPARDIQLAALATWIDQLIDHARQLGSGRTAAGWSLEHVAAPISQRLGSVGAEVVWFHHQLQRAVLSASNHLGDLTAARAAMNELDRLTTALAGRWEHADVLLRGMLVSAVHQTDCFEHEAAAKKAHVVAEFYENIAGLCHDALGEVFPKIVRSQLRGEALGTELQARMYQGGLDRREQLSALREISDLAIDQFQRDDDRGRQFQYRCQLETLAGEFGEARRFLAKAVGVETDSLATVWQRLLEAGWAQRWFTLHGARLVARMLLHGTESERTEAREIVRRFSGSFEIEAGTQFPQHGILRHAAAAFAASGDHQRSLSSLGRLRRLCAEGEATKSPLLTTILVGSNLEVAASLARSDPRKARELVESEDRERPGAKKLVEQVLRGTSSIPGFQREFKDWPARLSALVAKESDPERMRSELLSMAARVGY